MPRGRKTTNTANPENETKKKTKRRKKTVETPVEAAPAVENAATDAVVNVPVEVAEAPAPKKRGRKPKDAADAVTTEAPVKKTRGRKPKAAAETVADTPADTTTDAPVKKTRGRKAKAETPADAPVKQTRGRKKATLEVVAEAAPPVEAETAVEDASVNIQPDVIVDVPDSVVEEPIVAELLPDQLANDATESASTESTPAKKPRKPRAKETDKKAADTAPKKRGRKPKETGPALITTLQIGDIEFDISGIAEKAYKEYKRVHKRKVVTDFRVYVKPEEGAAYYTVNGEGSEDFKVDLT